jgi:SAM-dependent methyltransferase
MFIYREIKELAQHESLTVDIGTKDGRYLSGIKGKVIGLDVNLQSNETETEACYMRADGCNLPFLDDSFDFIIANQVFEHISHVQRARMIAEISRVLRIDGQFLMSFPNRYFPIGGTPHGLPLFYTFLPRSLGLALGNLLIDESKFNYYKNHLFPVSPWVVRDLLKKHFDKVEYVTVGLGSKYGEDIWPKWFYIPFSLFLTLFGRTITDRIFESLFSYTAYKCEVSS